MKEFTKALTEYLNGAPKSIKTLYHFPEKLGEYTVYGINNIEKGIFIECSNVPEKFKESFANISLKSETYIINNREKSGLSICGNPDDFSIPVFINICRAFYEPTDGQLEDNLKYPEKWVREWKINIGNKLSCKPTYQILGELLGIEELILKGYQNVIWEGPKSGVNDISARGEEAIFVEVKSTIQRTSTEVIMPEEYEIQKAHYLLFYRFEDTPSGELSLESQITNLKKIGFDCQEFNRLLSLDTSILCKKYHLLETKSYIIDDNFPNRQKGFINGTKPPGIGHIQYGVLLGGLDTYDIPPNCRTGH